MWHVYIKGSECPIKGLDFLIEKWNTRTAAQGKGEGKDDQSIEQEIAEKLGWRIDTRKVGGDVKLAPCKYILKTGISWPCTDWEIETWNLLLNYAKQVREMREMIVLKNELLLRVSTFVVMPDKLSSEECYDARMDAKRVVRHAQIDAANLTEKP